MKNKTFTLKNEFKANNHFIDRFIQSTIPVGKTFSLEKVLENLSKHIDKAEKIFDFKEDTGKFDLYIRFGKTGFIIANPITKRLITFIGEERAGKTSYKSWYSVHYRWTQMIMEGRFSELLYKFLKEGHYKSGIKKKNV